MYLTTGGGDLSRKKTHYSYGKEMFSGRVKPFRIIGSPRNRLPDKWSSVVIHNTYSTESDCVIVALIIQQGTRMRHIVL